MLILFTMSGVIFNAFLAAGVKSDPYTFKSATAEFSLGNAGQLIIMVSFFGTVILADNIFGDEYGAGTMRTSVASGIRRSHMLFGKMAIMVSVTMIVYVIAVILEYMSATWLPLGDGYGLYSKIFVRIAIASFPLVINSSVFTLCLYFMFRRGGACYLTFVVLMWIIPYITGSLFSIFIPLFGDIAKHTAFDRLYSLLSQYEAFEDYGSRLLWICGESICRIAAMTSICWFSYSRSEIK